jgi:hypothetical protein
MKLIFEKLIVNTSSQETARISEGALPYSCESLHWWLPFMSQMKPVRISTIHLALCGSFQ